MPRDRLIPKDVILRTIRNWLVHHGNAPTIQELRGALGVGSTRTVLRYLQRLEEEGDIERWPGARGMRLLRHRENGLETTAVPLIGEVAAGTPILAEENYETWLQLPRSFVPAGAPCFLLRIRGNSMNRARIEDHTIEDGDLVLVRQQPNADANSIVVALIDGSATVKRFVPGPGYVVLKPESTDSEHRPIIVADDFQIQGVVKKVIKRGAEVLDSEGV